MHVVANLYMYGFLIRMMITPAGKIMFIFLFFRGYFMNNLNSIILEGNLVRDATLAEPVPGFKKCIFSMGVNRFYKNRKNEAVDEVSFFDVETYGRMAEYCSEKAKKGRGVRVVGRLKQDTWKDDNGKTLSRVYVVAEHIEYKPEKKTDAEEAVVEKKAETPQTPAPAPEQGKEPVPVEEEAVF